MLQRSHWMLSNAVGPHDNVLITADQYPAHGVEVLVHSHDEANLLLELEAVVQDAVVVLVCLHEVTFCQDQHTLPQ